MSNKNSQTTEIVQKFHHLSMKIKVSNSVQQTQFLYKC